MLLPAAYVAGSINFAIILFRLMGKEDPRKGFSGNPGATNVYRHAGLFWAGAVLLLDMGRAIGTALLAIAFLSSEMIPWAGFFLIIGNRFPCFHGFSGGKGVANYLGFSAVLVPWAAAVSAAVWFVINKVTAKPFIASFGMVFVLGVFTALKFEQSDYAILGTILTVVLIVVNHKKNIIESFNSAGQ